jgi:hypothetical protein
MRGVLLGASVGASVGALVGLEVGPFVGLGVGALVFKQLIIVYEFNYKFYKNTNLTYFIYTTIGLTWN